MKYSGVLLAVLGTLYLSCSNAADFKCDYLLYTGFEPKNHFDLHYTCRMNVILPSSDNTITHVVGDHKYRDQSTTKYTNAHVEELELSRDMIQIPKGLSTWFPRMKSLLTEKLLEVTRSDFSNLKQLSKLEISVDYLPANVFEDLVNLKELILFQSSIELFPPMVFNKLLQLVFIDISMGYAKTGKMKELPADLFQNNFNLKEISFHRNGLTCIRDGLLDGLNKLAKVSFIECIAENYPNVTLSALKDKIHNKCQKCENLIESPDTEFGGPSGACAHQLNTLQAEYNKLKVQKDCNSKQQTELHFKYNKYKK